MSTDQHIAVRVIVSGRVQGVWYRDWTVREAGARGLEGWVRNRRDGTVGALFSGPEPMVREMIVACQDGPPLAKVEAVEAQDAAVLAAGAGFRQRSSA
jgi:acylphosphatase